MKRAYSAYVVGSTVLIISLGITLLLALNQGRKHEQESRNQTLTYLSAVRARLEGAFNSTIYLNRALSVLVTAQEGITGDKFNLIAREMMASNHHIRNVGLAEGYVITHMYPLAGNREALGLDYRKNTNQWPAVRRAIESRQTVVAGPVELVQGGIALVNRTPIFKSTFSNGPDSGDYWGIASIVIDMDSMFAAAGLPDPVSLYRVAIRGKDGLGAAGEVFWGDARLFEQAPELLEVTFPSGSWQLAAIPHKGWSAVGGDIPWILAAGVIISLLLATLTTIIHRNNLRIKHIAMHDQLTRLPNRLQFNERVSQALAHAQRHQGQVAIAVLDLNQFKPVNDSYGHLAGDHVLQQVAARIRGSLRREDIVARTGGDEFTLLLVDIHSMENIVLIAEKLTEQLLVPFSWRGQSLHVGVSIGIALYPAHGKDLTSLFHQADIAMYNAKHDPDTHWMIASLPESRILGEQTSLPI